MRAIVLVSGLALLGSAPGCLLPFFDFSSLGTTDSMVYRRLTREQLWDWAKDVVNREFRLKEIDEEDFVLVSEWDEHLGPMFRSGFRRRAHVWIQAGDKGPYLQVQVERERNVEIKNPMEPNAADWEGDGRDEATERRLIYMVEAKLGLHETPSKESLRTSPYRTGTQESDADRERRLWGGLEPSGKGKTPE